MTRTTDTAPVVAALSAGTDLGTVVGTPTGFAGHEIAARASWQGLADGVNTVPAVNASCSWSNAGGTVTERAIIRTTAWPVALQNLPVLGWTVTQPSYLLGESNASVVFAGDWGVHDTYDFDVFFDTIPWGSSTSRWNDRLQVTIDWGDGDTSIFYRDTVAGAFGHAYGDPGQYTVMLTAVDQFGNTDPLEPLISDLILVNNPQSEGPILRKVEADKVNVRELPHQVTLRMFDVFN
jgi:hypothetical protein